MLWSLWSVLKDYLWCDALSCWGKLLPLRSAIVNGEVCMLYLNGWFILKHHPHGCQGHMIPSRTLNCNKKIHLSTSLISGFNIMADHCMSPGVTWVFLVLPPKIYRKYFLHEYTDLCTTCPLFTRFSHRTPSNCVALFTAGQLYMKHKNKRKCVQWADNWSLSWVIKTTAYSPFEVKQCGNILYSLVAYKWYFLLYDHFFSPNTSVVKT